MSGAVIAIDQVRALTVPELLGRVALVQEVMGKVMHQDVHYGASYPGDTKKNLLKPGADKLCLAFQLVPEFAIETHALGGDHREVRCTCILRTSAGNAVGQGVGSCSTMESKYRWRNQKPSCPSCHKPTVIRTKRGWWCAPDKGGCGANPEDSQMESQPRGKVENADIADVYNTVLKMGKKRSFVDAVITATAASDMFTQDLEDLEDELQEARANEPAQQQAQANGEKKVERTADDIAAQETATKLYAEFTKLNRGIATVTWCALNDGWPGKIANLNAARSACRAIEEKLGANMCDELLADLAARAGYRKDMKAGEKLDRKKCSELLAELLNPKPAQVDPPAAEPSAASTSANAAPAVNPDADQPPY